MPAFYPDRLESGTVSYPAVCSLFEGALYVKARRAETAQRLLAVTAALAEALRALDGYRAYFSPNACGIAACAHERIPSERIAQELSERYAIAVRGGLHCAPLMHEYLKTEQGLVRASLSEFNTPNEVLTLFSAVRDIAHKYA